MSREAIVRTPPPLEVSSSQVPDYFQPNTIYCGDCLEVLRKFPDKCVDLIYADPPFFSDRHYEIIWDNGSEIRGFNDRWKGRIQNYLSWMVDKLEECYRVLKDKGSMYLHCDWHASHYLKVELDNLFGIKNFNNEIVWRRTTSPHNDPKKYGANHDTLLFYSKTRKNTWNTQYMPLNPEYVKNTFRYNDEDGRKYRLNELTAAKPGGDVEYAWKGKYPPKGRYWAYSKENMNKLDQEGLIHYSKSGMPRKIQYLDESKGRPVQTFWDDIPPLRQKERVGYPTQKPESLLNRLINASSNPTDILLDPFCGCGTAIAVAHKLGRRWIGIDVSPTACKVMETRMRSIKARDFHVLGMPMGIKDLKNLEPFEFQNWVINRLHGRVSQRRVWDMGIDGYTYEGDPVQVKQSKKVGRNVVDNFETALRRANKDSGLIVAFSFSRGAYEEIARAKLHDGLDIEAVQVEDLLNNRRNRNFTQTN